jgi:hypothetical protein
LATHHWPRIKKTYRKRYSIVFIDESGFMLQPVRRRTWAPKGKTPAQYSWDRHDRLSVISAITVSPKRQHLGLYFHIHPHNIRSEQVVPFLKALHKHLGRRFILVLDRYIVHRKTVRLLRREHPNWFLVEWFPSYAPDIIDVCVENGNTYIKSA